MTQTTLLDAVMRYTRAHHASLWDWPMPRISGQIVGLADGPHPLTVLAMRADLSERLRTTGWARTDSVDRRPEIVWAGGPRDGLEWVGGEMILAATGAHTGRVAIAAAPAGGRFGPLDAAIVRTLTELVNTYWPDSISGGWTP